MATDTQLYKLPNGLQTLAANYHEIVPEFDPALTIIDMGQHGGMKLRYIRPYRWCYLDRLSLDTTVTSLREIVKVNLLSLCPQRAKIVHQLVSSILIGSLNPRVFEKMTGAFDWIDQQNRGAELFALESTKGLYRDYTGQLRHRIQLSNVGAKAAGALAYSTAFRNQLSMAFICAAATGLDTSTVQSWAYRIPQRAPGPSRALSAAKTTENEHVVAHAMHTRFFTALSDAILNNAPPPAVVELADLGFEDVIFYNKKTNSANGWTRGGGKDLPTDWMPYFYRREGFFKGSFKEFNELLAANGIESIRNESDSYKRRQRSAQVFAEADLRYMANLASRHFGYLLLAEAGSNASTLATVDCSQVRLDKELGASRLLAVKGRAGYEQQDQFVDRRFTQTVWKRYLELRAWMVQRLCKQGFEAPQNGLFLLAYQLDREPYTPLRANNIRQCGLWPNNGPALATREARKHKTVNIIESSGGNIALASAMQAVSPQTVERHYAHKNLIEATKHMSEYFELQAKSAALRYAGLKPVRIIEDGEDTSTGHCDVPEVEGPKLVEGFEETGIEPRCGAPLTCLFCIHFGLHAVDEDLVRLLTIQRWVEVQTQLYASNLDEGFAKYSPYIERIDQVFKELPKSSKELAELVRHTKVLFAEGKRDPYWIARINALLDLEAV